MKVVTVLWLLLVALVMAVVAIFAVSNAGPVEISFFHWHHPVSLALVVVGSFLFGGIVMAALAVPGRIRLGLRVRHLERQMASAAGAVDSVNPPATALPGEANSAEPTPFAVPTTPDSQQPSSRPQPTERR